MVMQLLYITHAVNFLIEFYSDFLGGWQIGAYFTLFTIMIYLTYIIVNLKSQCGEDPDENAIIG